MTTTRDQSAIARRGWETRRANGRDRHTDASRAKMALSMMDRWCDPDYRERVTEAARAGLLAGNARRRAERGKVDPA